MDLKAKIYQASTPLLLGIIVLLAFSMRLYHLDYQSLWVDEIASMNGANPDLTIQGVIEYSVADQPPAFVLLLHSWFKFFPYTDWYGRFFSTLLGIAGVIAIFFLGKEVKSAGTGLIAAGITTFSYIHIYFSQEVRFYTLVYLASTLSYLFFIRTIKSQRKADFIFYTISTVVLIYTHYFGLVVLAVQGILFILLIVFYSRDRNFIVSSVLSGLSVCILVSPWSPVFFSDAQTENFWIHAEPFYFPLKYFYVYFKDYFSCIVFAALILYYLYHQYKIFKSEKRIDPVDFVLPASVVLSFLIPLAYSILKTPMLQERYTLIALPCIVVVISLGFCLLRVNVRNGILIAACCTILFSLVAVERFYTRVRKEDWRGLVTKIIQTADVTDVVISRQPWYCNYYFKSLNSELRAILPEDFHLEQSQHQGIWWMDAFEVTVVPPALEKQLSQNGYVLHHSDSLNRAAAFYYKHR